MMEGVGLLNALTVHSPFGEAAFVTLPQVKGITIRKMPAMAVDVFHKAKILLSCLRFGENRSTPSRGRIDTAEKLMNIVNKLLRGEWVGPATAIGEDYQLLERDGVIETQAARWGMYQMRLRQREVGILVKQMLEYDRVITEADVEPQKLLEAQPSDYTIPEHRRSEVLAEHTKSLQHAREDMLRAIRT